MLNTKKALSHSKGGRAFLVSYVSEIMRNDYGGVVLKVK